MTNKKTTKYTAVMISPDGKLKTNSSFAENTVSKVVGDFYEKGDYNYNNDYKLIIKVQGDVTDLSNTDLMKKKIVYALDPVGFMKGWTIKRAMKKIVTEN